MLKLFYDKSKSIYYYIDIGRKSYNMFGEGDSDHADRSI
jgi:hypothetical protein